MRFSKGTVVAVAIALSATTALGCPYITRHRELMEEGHDEATARRILHSEYYSDQYGHYSDHYYVNYHGHRHPYREERGNCHPFYEGCYGKIFDDLPACEFHWKKYMDISLPYDRTDEAFYMHDNGGFFPPDEGTRVKAIVDESESRGYSFPSAADFGVGVAQPSDSNNTGPAGYTYLGQLFSHDVNKDKLTKLGERKHPNDIKNAVTAKADLDTIYGSGDDCDVYLQKGVDEDSDDRYKFAFHGTSVTKEIDGTNVTEYCDFPRYRSGKTIYMPDDRNDNNMVLGRITAAFMKLHNKLFHIFREEELPALEAFKKAKLEVQRNWQSVIAYDLMPNFIAHDVWEDIFVNHTLKFYCPRDDCLGQKEYQEMRIPVEFSTCAYRVFHSRLATGYFMGGGVGFWTVFSDDPENTRTFEGSRYLDKRMASFRMWRFFSICGSQTFHKAHMLDMLYPPAITKLPPGVSGNPDEIHKICCKECTDNDQDGFYPHYPYPGDGEHCHNQNCYVIDNIEGEGENELYASLALADLARADVHGVACGEAMAAAAQVVDPDIEIYDIEAFKESVWGYPEALYGHKSVPCLLYFMFESLIEQKGKVLGRLASIIVGEVAKGTIKNTEDNFLDVEGWTSMVKEGEREIKFEDILKYIDSLCFDLFRPGDSCE